MAPSKLDRRQVMARLLDKRGDLLLVTGLGGTTWDAAAAGDNDLNFYVWGGMGYAAMIGLGLALARPDRRVLVVTGDGEMLMGLGGLATIAAAHPVNLAVVVFDNGVYGETGMQLTHTAMGADLAAIAQGAGIAESTTVVDQDGVAALAKRIRVAPGPLFAAVKIDAKTPPMVLPPRDGGYLKNRFRLAVIGAGAV